MSDDLETVRQALHEFHDRTGMPEHALDRIEAGVERLRGQYEMLVAHEADLAEKYERLREENAALLSDPLTGELKRLRAELKDTQVELMDTQDREERLREENERLREDNVAWEKKAIFAHAKFFHAVDEVERLRAALKEIATETWNPAIGVPAKSYSELHEVARRALEGSE